jgi:hypothetical protein
MNLYSLQSWSESIAGRCPQFDALVEPLPDVTVLDGDDQLCLVCVMKSFRPIRRSTVRGFA